VSAAPDTRRPADTAADGTPGSDDTPYFDDTPCFDAAALREFATGLLRAGGMREDLARDTADVLVESDLLGYPTHGLAFLPAYLDRLAKGHMARDGEVTVVNETPSTFSWQANRLPGAWVMRRAIEATLARMQSQAVVIATIANSSHIGCLQAYLPEITRHGLMAILSATNPGIATVAPFGGIDPVLTSNPIAVGMPTAGLPILVDVSTSLVTNAAVYTRQQTGTPFDTPCLLDNQGAPSTDPAVLAAKPPGTILPIGGVEFGHKGFGLGLVVEALALALSGGGRALAPDTFGQSVFLQVIDPRHLGGGLDYFMRETTELAARCRASRVAPGRPPVRLPGERSLGERARRLQKGVPIDARVQERLAAHGRTVGIEFPQRLDRRRR